MPVINKIFEILTVLVAIMGVAISILLYGDNQDLLYKLEQRTELISQINATDSVYVEKTKEYAKTIKQYYTGPSFSVNGKTVTPAELIEHINRTSNENDSLLLKLRECYRSRGVELETLSKCNSENISLTDSLNYITSVHTQFLELLKKDLDLNYRITYHPNSFVLSRPPSKIDTALFYYDYKSDKRFRDSIKQETRFKFSDLKNIFNKNK